MANRINCITGKSLHFCKEDKTETDEGRKLKGKANNFCELPANKLRFLSPLLDKALLRPKNIQQMFSFIKKRIPTSYNDMTAWATKYAKIHITRVEAANKCKFESNLNTITAIPVATIVTKHLARNRMKSPTPLTVANFRELITRIFHAYQK